MITSSGVFSILIQENPTLTQTQIDTVYAGLDLNAIATTQRARVTTLRWVRGQPLSNGFDPLQDERSVYNILKNNTNTEAFEILIDGSVSRFEYTDFLGSGGGIISSRIATVENIVLQTTIDSMVDDAIVGAVRNSV